MGVALALHLAVILRYSAFQALAAALAERDPERGGEWGEREERAQRPSKDVSGADVLRGPGRYCHRAHILAGQQRGAGALSEHRCEARERPTPNGRTEVESWFPAQIPRSLAITSPPR
eukprot:scaffold7340_cov266-Pinguiococcus_pyrenoidosus.AAC.3